MPRCMNVDVVKFKSLDEGPVQEGCIEGTCALAVLSTRHKQAGNYPTLTGIKGLLT